MDEKIEKFEDGLNGDIRFAFTGGWSDSLSVAYDRACLAESDLGIPASDHRKRVTKKQSERERGPG